MSTPMPVDSEEMVVEPIVEQVDQVITIIDSVRDFISNTAVTWNKNQCRRIANRYNAIGERLKSMGLDRNSDGIGGGDSNSGLIFHELVKILKKGRTLVQSHVASKVITSTVVSRTDNREAFEEIHEDLDILVAKFGLQSLHEEAELSPEMEKLNLRVDAEKDKMAMPEIFSQLQTTSMDHDSEKLAQVLLDKTTNHVHVEKLVAASDKHAGARRALPSYLTIVRKSEIVIDDQLIVRPYVRQSERDLKDEVGWTTVRPGKWLGCDFAIKVFKCGADHGGADQWNRNQLLMEVGSLVELQHPHVVRLVGFGQDEEACVFVMEMMDEDLRNFMKTKRTFPGNPSRRLKNLTL